MRLAPVLTLAAFGALTAGGMFVDGGRGSTLPPRIAALTTESRSTDAGLSTELYPTRLLWGDLHVHSSLSFDSYSFGNDRLDPEQAYRFAMGEPVRAHNGKIARLARPLDFILISDHAEYLGIFDGLNSGDAELLSSDLGQRWSGYLKAGTQAPISREYVEIVERRRSEPPLPARFVSTQWQRQLRLAEMYNRPGMFTTLIGYEWSSMTDGNNLHRNVVFRDNSDRAGQIVPFSALDSQDPEDLWTALANYEVKTGGKALAIPHNGNLSNGLMFADARFNGAALDAAYANARQRWEPLYEVTQTKGDAETHPALSPNDEFASFERWDQGNMRMIPKQAGMLEHEYARSALKLGLELEARIGANPFKFGMVGATDTHTGLSTADDNNFWGKFVDSEPSPARLTTALGNRLWPNWQLTASGYTGVWATANTREAIFDALQRREVYASTGPRISLRFFGGWRFGPADARATGIAQSGYAKGVPMGGELTGGSSQQPPGFLVQALKDPNGAHLDRVQIVKGWIDRSGKSREKVFDVALSNARKIDGATGRAPALRSTVNLSDAAYRNSIGAVALTRFWRDPEFDPAAPAFYYVRVIEIPTPRWTAYDTVRFKVKPGREVALVNQERAYSSPIWYRPADKRNALR